ncbi:hypothetical protein [Akkermansia sp.]|uniref:hypothetical protein n=1 Tax=Akkermansia sp. TaxID=1872421 RepID=UPI0025BE9E43|nr:hypothetical protein [Akkermansia sp.]MCC8149311.1 hypothetical protein [Akkermansia sp.]
MADMLAPGSKPSRASASCKLNRSIKNILPGRKDGEKTNPRNPATFTTGMSFSFQGKEPEKELPPGIAFTLTAAAKEYRIARRDGGLESFLSEAEKEIGKVFYR